MTTYQLSNDNLPDLLKRLNRANYTQPPLQARINQVNPHRSHYRSFYSRLRPCKIL